MKTFLLKLCYSACLCSSLLCSVPGLTFAYSSVDVARANILATGSGQVIVNHSDDPALYRLDDTMLRQELIGIALQISGLEAPWDYVCRGYFSDATFASAHMDAWVCRAFEIMADKGFVTRANKTTRPRDSVTRAEALAMVVQGGQISLTPGNYTTNWLKKEGYADWQTKLLSSLTDCRIYNQGQSCEDGSELNTAIGNFRPNSPATRADVFEFLMYTPHFQALQNSFCAQYFENLSSGIDPDISIITLEKIVDVCPNI